MASAIDILTDSFERVSGSLHRVLDGLDDDQLTGRIDPEANTIGWLVWHLTRGQDAQISDVAGTPQLWLEDGWVDRFDLPFAANATGYAQSADEVGQVAGVSATLLADYFDAVHARTLAYIASLSDGDLDRVVDTNWDPPVTLAARLVSVVNDDVQHVGQAAFVKGVLARSQK
ncbi:mycothiol transferase [Subtercola sp. YIM 133946]|uniref:mycothiol transferase n=1 Tax=Subtercola sp. YIM 133946 TaxID=3118909 RepID=UPI002F92B505